MATIQIRDVPDSVHRTYKTRAAAAGQSLQEYLLAELVQRARTKTPAEVMDDVQRRIDATGGVGYATGSAAELIRADRESH